MADDDRADRVGQDVLEGHPRLDAPATRVASTNSALTKGEELGPDEPPETGPGEQAERQHHVHMPENTEGK